MATPFLTPFETGNLEIKIRIWEGSFSHAMKSCQGLKGIHVKTALANGWCFDVSLIFPMSYVSVYAMKKDGTHHLMLSMICTVRRKTAILESNCEAIDSSCPSSSGFSQLPHTGGFKEMRWWILAFLFPKLGMRLWDNQGYREKTSRKKFGGNAPTSMIWIFEHLTILDNIQPARM